MEKEKREETRRDKSGKGDRVKEKGSREGEKKENGM